MSSGQQGPQTAKPLSANEELKGRSNFLRGTLTQDLADPSTGAISDDNAQLTKFHGLYLQDDRDLRGERRKQNLEKAFMFMLRVRLPGGRCTAQQYLVLDRLADERGNGTLRLTTRQTFQLHGILKGNVKPLIQGMHTVLLDSIAACGDVNRNVMAPPNPEHSAVHQQVYELARAFSEFALPRTRAYHEIWLDEELAAGGETEQEPLYGATYLPRKFKTGFAIPPSNDVDLFSQDLGFIAIVAEGRLAGFNVAVGGGMGMSHGNAETFPRLADVIGFISCDKVLAIGEAVITTQRDYGDRTNRKHARLKYTIEDRGIGWFKAEVERRAGFALAPARPYQFTKIADDYGWHRAADGSWYFVLFVLSGRIKDTPPQRLKAALREIARIHRGDFRLTPSQNISISGISEAQKPLIEAILAKHGLADQNRQSGLRLNALACVALPTCGLALAESERALPPLLEKLEHVLDECGLRDDAISIRMTGCPNGCSRPYLAEIGIVGRAPNKYNLYLGAKYDGTRLNRLFVESVTPEKLVEIVTPILRRYALERTPGEQFGDFCLRTVLVEPRAPAPALSPA
ncbi:MAG: NADPH-dependent assimilatory sulfite reductase hemoprotein subunit [Opitutaceae bacterium]|nr:NADPH-dependent assimilatory sulfite reductase hemoprotein subunit [Opitutaceae bacterium]